MLLLQRVLALYMANVPSTAPSAADHPKHKAASAGKQLYGSEPLR